MYHSTAVQIAAPTAVTQSPGNSYRLAAGDLNGCLLSGGRCMIRRSPERRRWTTIDNRTIEDERLSFGALGMLTYILSKPDNWTIRTADMMKRGGIKRPTYSKWLAELEAAGYAVLSRTVGGRGRFSGTTWCVSETPSDRDTVWPILGQGAGIVSTEPLVIPETAVSTETSSPPAAEQVTADTTPTSKGQPKTRKPRDPGPWAAFRDQALTDYGQPSTGPTQALVTRIVKTAEHHGLDPAKAARLWAEWRAETKANGTAKFAPLHLASQAWGEWIAANKTNTATLDIPRSVSIRGVRL